MLPSYLNFKTAGKILFTGEALQLFKPKFIRETELKINQTLDEQLQMKFHIHDDSNGVLKAEFSIMNEQLDEYSREMHELALNEAFSIVKNLMLILTKFEILFLKYISSRVFSLE
jgi:hypothetical protein